MERLPYKAIAAMSENRAIGRDNDLPWDLPEDVRWLMLRTRRALCVMGRKTFESMPKPMKNRETVIVTRQRDYTPRFEAKVIHELDDCLPLAQGREIFIFGGEEIYRLAMPKTSEIYLTHVHRTVDGDAFFPPFEASFRADHTLRQTPEFSIVHYTRLPVSNA
ncbi:MAG: dihydrofolate reductase [Opitutales bacterium]